MRVPARWSVRRSAIGEWSRIRGLFAQPEAPPSVMTHSKVRQSSKARLSDRFRRFARYTESGVVPVSEEKIPLAREMMRIFLSLSDPPDFYQYFERDLDRRVRNSWARVGNAMRLALGETVETVPTHPDRRGATRLVHPVPPREEYRDALDRARRCVQASNSDDAKFRMNVYVTGDAVRVIEALIRDTAGREREAQGERSPS